MPEPLFILATARSYTSLIGTMIGQHPQIYGLPEVNLAVADTLGGMMQVLKGPFAFAQAGTLRLLAEINDGKQTEASIERARQWMTQRPHWSTQAVFEYIQSKVGEDRILLDKSPATVMQSASLERLHGMFPNANFLHLIRHPITTGKSALTLREAQGVKRNVDPEFDWLNSRSNIVEFMDKLPLGQCMNIKAEMLLSDPPKYLAQICEWLGISSEPDAIDAMMHPETSPFACIGPPSARYGSDPNFLENPVLDMSRLQNIKEPPLDTPIPWRDDGSILLDDTQRLCRRFGYG